MELFRDRAKGKTRARTRIKGIMAGETKIQDGESMILIDFYLESDKLILIFI